MKKTNTFKQNVLMLILMIVGLSNITAQNVRVPKWLQGKWIGDAVEKRYIHYELVDESEYQISITCEKKECFVEYRNENFACSATWTKVSKFKKGVEFREKLFDTEICLDNLHPTIKKENKDFVYSCTSRELGMSGMETTSICETVLYKAPKNIIHF